MSNGSLHSQTTLQLMQRLSGLKGQKGRFANQTRTQLEEELRTRPASEKEAAEKRLSVVVK